MARFMSHIADPRAVLLSRDPSFLPEHLGQVAIDRVASAYEAAAKILSSPVLALVVDLRALGRRHYRLLDVARQRACQVLICGNLGGGLSTAELNGVQLVSPSQLSAVLDQLALLAVRPPLEPFSADTAAVTDAASPAQQQAQETQPGQAGSDSQSDEDDSGMPGCYQSDLPAVPKTNEESSQGQAQGRGSFTPAHKPDKSDKPGNPQAKPAGPAEIAGVLSDDELSALRGLDQ